MMPYYLWIASRYLRARGGQSLLTITGVVLGVTIVTVMQSFFGGLLNFFIQRALASTPSVEVTRNLPGVPNPANPVLSALGSLNNPAISIAQLPVPREEEELKNPQQAEDFISRIPGVSAISPFVNGHGIAVNGDLREPVNFIGVYPQREAKVTDLAQRLTAGTLDALASRADGVILGFVLADDLSVRPGDQVTIISQLGISERFRVVGIYASQIQEVDQTRAYMNLRQAQQLLGTRGVSGLGVHTVSLDDAVPVARYIEQVQPQYTTHTWREINSGFLDLFTSITTIIYLVVALTMVTAGFGVANTLILTVNEKQRDIGVLKAMGMAPGRVALLFLSIGIIVGIIGVLFGEIAGATIIALLSKTGIPVRPGTPGPAIEVQMFPMLRIPRVYILSGVFGFLVSVASSLLPSLRAAKSDPLVVIRGAE